MQHFKFTDLTRYCKKLSDVLVMRHRGDVQEPRSGRLWASLVFGP